MTKKRGGRRWWGRPKDGPGPQETYEGQFQVDIPQPPPVDGSQYTFTVVPPPRGEREPFVQRSISAPVRGPSAREGGLTSSRPRERRPSRGAHNNSAPLASSARRGRLEVDAAEPGPSRRRPSVSGHRSTQSHPTVSTVEAAGGNYMRSQSSTVLASEMGADAGMHAGPSSWPRAVHPPVGVHPPADALMPMSPIYPGQNRAPSTPGVGYGQYSPPSLVRSTFNTPSTGSLPLSLRSPQSYHYRHGSYDLPESSPTDTSSWHYPSPAHRNVSVPPSSSAASPSPYMEPIFGDFSPPFGPSDAAELPPLTPDQLPEDPVWDSGSYSRPQHPQMPNRGPLEAEYFGAAPALSPAIPVPEPNTFIFPSEVFETGNQHTYPLSDADLDHFLETLVPTDPSLSRPSGSGHSAQADRRPPPGY